MLEIVVQGAIGALVLALAAQLGLWTLRVRRPKPLLSTWTAVLIVSMAMPAILSAMAACGAHASEPHWILAGSKWPAGIYLIATALLVLRLLWGLALSLKMLRATPLARRRCAHASCQSLTARNHSGSFGNMFRYGLITSRAASLLRSYRLLLIARTISRKRYGSR